ncbi:hypothetical protein KBC79_04690, partial [Candidatus Woesebacteria bacterium]|nr:hypothetical protein [Candidatus Woesebacteria bacterium]
MRRREKFVVSSISLSIGLFGVLQVPLDLRYLAVAAFMLLTYGVATWALADDLQTHERVTVVPFPALYAGAVSLFYFLLPTHFLSQVAVLSLFGVGMYALFLTANIWSVAKGRTIQLIHAAHAVGLLFTLLTSLLLTNTIFSLRLNVLFSVLLVALAHGLLIFMSLWSVQLENRIEKRIVGLTGLMTLVVCEVALTMSFFPFSVWYRAL